MIELINLWKSYGDLRLLKGLSWKIKEKRKIGLLGDNGVGKTTLLKIIAGLIEPDQGEVIRRSAITAGYLPQEMELTQLDVSPIDFAMSAREDLVKLEHEIATLERALQEKKKVLMNSMIS